MITFDDIDELVKKAQEPISNLWLRRLPERHVYYRFLYHLMTVRKPRIALELGTHRGFASAYMAAAASAYGGHVIGVDINANEWTLGKISERYDNFHFILSDTIKAIRHVGQFVDRIGKIGVVYQDSSHHYQASCDEWDAYRPLLDERAVWICDDITEAFCRPGLDAKSMVGYFEERPGEKRLYEDVLHSGNTMGVILCD